MPVRYEQTRELEEAGLIHTVGLIQEQHDDRAKLFMQWKEMDFPIMVDSLNRLGVRVVPITVLIDEAGIVRAVRPSEEEIEVFAREASPDAAQPGHADEKLSERPNLAALRASAQADDTTENVVALADALVEWRGDAAALGQAIEIYERLLDNDPANAAIHFRAGVAYRKRFDLDDVDNPNDFNNAIAHWKKALDLDPNQYIWRRRIQQYGPRLDKPYSFYDWVDQARNEIRNRGEQPHPLKVEPSGAEFAYPSRNVAHEEDDASDAARVVEPDPDREIQRDSNRLIGIETVHVPSTQTEQRNIHRVHLVFSPNDALRAHWNNEVEGLVVWLDPPDGVELSNQLLTHPNPTDSAVSDETRIVEFELQAIGIDGDSSSNPPIRVPGYALYYVCEGAEGTCLYLRQDFEVTIEE